MRLTRVAVEGVGRFGTPARIEGLGPGVNILAAGNEAGKSTFFRAIRACLFERHGTKNSDVLALATEGRSLPVSVTLGFEHAGTPYELTKSFLKSPAASLRRDGVEIARNREADEQVWEILGIMPGGGRSVDEAAFGILWVSQGQSFHVPEPSEAATSALNAAIQQEVGTLVGGERARQVLASLKADLSRQLTDGGKPRTGSALAKATQLADTLSSELELTEKRLAELDASLEELAKSRGQLKGLTDFGEAARLKKEMEEAAQQLKAGEDAAAILLRCEEDDRRSAILLKAQGDTLEGIRDRGRRIDDNRRRCTELADELAPLDEREIAARNQVIESRTEIEELDGKIAALEDQDRHLQRISSLAQRAASRDTTSARLKALQDFAARLARSAAALKANIIDDAATRSLDEIEKEMAALTARLESAAAQLTIERRGSAEVTVNGQSITTGTVRAVTEPLAIMVSDLVAITVSPPQTSLAASHKQKEDLQLQMRALLAKHSVNTPAELRQRRAERVILEDESRGFKTERTVLGIKDNALAEEIARLSAEVMQIDTEMEKILVELGVGSLPSPGEIDGRRTDLQQARAQFRNRRIQSESVIAGQNTILTDIGGARGKLQGQLTEIESQLAADLAILPDDRRLEIIHAAERDHVNKSDDHRIKAALLAEKRRQAPQPDEIERRRNRLQRLTDAIRNREQLTTALNQRIAHLEGQVQTAGGDGLGERAADFRAQLDMAQTEVGRQTVRVETLQLLRDVVEASYEKHREQLNAPLRRHLKPFLNDVFPQAEVELGDGFAVSGLRRHGPCSETLERLSAGTQEQIAVLVRLAMGAMICERGQEVPVVLDDALVFSDDARIEQMFDALNRAGKKQQIIVLTCRTRTFASLGGRQLNIDTGVVI